MPTCIYACLLLGYIWKYNLSAKKMKRKYIIYFKKMFYQSFRDV